MSKCDKIIDKIRKKLKSLNGYEDDFLFNKLTEINTITNELLDHYDINRKALFNKDKFDKIKHILNDVKDGTDYYLLEFNDGTSMQSYGEYTISDTEIIFTECVFFDAWDNGEEISEYNLNRERSTEVYAVKFYDAPHNQDDVIFI